MGPNGAGFAKLPVIDREAGLKRFDRYAVRGERGLRRRREIDCRWPCERCSKPRFSKTIDMGIVSFGSTSWVNQRFDVYLLSRRGSDERAARLGDALLHPDKPARVERFSIRHFVHKRRVIHSEEQAASLAFTNSPKIPAIQSERAKTGREEPADHRLDSDATVPMPLRLP